MSALMQRSRMRLETVQIAERAANEDFRDVVMRALGDLSDFHVLGTDVLVATYIAPKKTAGGIILTDKGVDEDRWQGKVGLVIKMGEDAFKYSYQANGAYEYQGKKPQVGDYVAFHTSDTRELGIRGVSCRTIDASLIRMIVPSPDDIY